MRSHCPASGRVRYGGPSRPLPMRRLSQDGHQKKRSTQAQYERRYDRQSREYVAHESSRQRFCNSKRDICRSPADYLIATRWILLNARSASRRSAGGWGGIRTHETLAGLPVFKTGAFNRSATHPVSAPSADGCKNVMIPQRLVVPKPLSHSPFLH